MSTLSSFRMLETLMPLPPQRTLLARGAVREAYVERERVHDVVDGGVKGNGVSRDRPFHTKLSRLQYATETASP